MYLNQVTYQIRRLNPMYIFSSKTPFASFQPPPNSSSFYFDDHPFAKSQFTIDTISNSVLHPWIPTQDFVYDCFDITKQKGGDLLGALNYIQQEQKNPFDINIRIPSVKEYTPFECFLRDNQRPDLSFFTSQARSSTIESNFLADIQDEISNIEEQKSKSKSKSQVEPNVSIFANLDLIRNEYPPELSRMKLWQEQIDELPLPPSPLIYSVYALQQTDIINRASNYYFESDIQKVPEQQIIIQLILALQGIEGKFLILDYETMNWSIRPQINFMVSYYYKQSIANYIQGILSLASMRSKIQVALQYLTIKESKKDIYSKLLQVYSSSKYLLDSLLMSYIKSPTTFLQLYLRLQPIKSQLSLLLALLIRQDSLNKAYCDFGKSYLHTQNQIFKLLFQKLTLNDSCQQDQKILIRQLGLSCFQGILFSLNIFLHYNRQQWQKTNNQQHFYFGLLFQQKKQYVDQMIEKLNIINIDDMEIYNICREKHNMRLIMDYVELKKYQHEWKIIFKDKIRQIKTIARRIQNYRWLKLQKIIQKRKIQYAKRKIRLMQQKEELSKFYQEQLQIKIALSKYLKQQIQKNKEKKKLYQLIQKQEDKAYLLNLQLEYMNNLIDEKNKLQAQLSKIMVKSMEVQPDNISIPSPEPQSMISQDQIKPPSPPTPLNQSKSTFPIQPKSKSSKQMPSLIQKSSIQSTTSPKFILQFQQSYKKSQQISPPLQHLDNDLNMEVPIQTVLQVCVYSIVKGQVNTLNQAYRTILYHKYRLDWIFQFLHSFILTSNGEHVIQLLHLSVDTHSCINTNYLKDYFFDESIRQQISILKPMFYRSDSNPMMGNLNLIQTTSERSLEVMIGLEFHNLPEILKPIFNYIHMAKYMEIFTFILRIRHSVQLIEAEWKNLQIYQRRCRGRVRDQKNIDVGMMKKLFDIRNKMQCFFNLFQNYFFFYVVEKEYKVLESIISKHQIDNLPQIHNKFLQKICLRGFIQTQHQLASRFKKTFSLVKEFHNIVGLFCADDIATYVKQDIEKRLRIISKEFVELHGVLSSAMG